MIQFNEHMFQMGWKDQRVELWWYLKHTYSCNVHTILERSVHFLLLKFGSLFASQKIDGAPEIDEFQ